MSSVGNTVAFQVTIAATGTAQQLPANALQNGGTLAAKTGNTAAIAVGVLSTTSETNGFLLQAGLQVPFSGNNTNQLWVEGTSGDVVSFLGN